jgi:hypothetical protein
VFVEDNPFVAESEFCDRALRRVAGIAQAFVAIHCEAGERSPTSAVGIAIVELFLGAPRIVVVEHFRD